MFFFCHPGSDLESRLPYSLSARFDIYNKDSGSALR